MIVKLCDIYGYENEKLISQILHREFNNKNNRYKDLTVSFNYPNKMCHSSSITSTTWCRQDLEAKESLLVLRDVRQGLKSLQAT